MPTCEVSLKEIRFDTRQMGQHVDVYFLIEVIGDVEFDGRPDSGWRYKRFEGNVSPVRIFPLCGDHLQWPIKSPPSDDESEGPSVILSGNVPNALGISKKG